MWVNILTAYFSSLLSYHWFCNRRQIMSEIPNTNWRETDTILMEISFPNPPTVSMVEDGISVSNVGKIVIGPESSPGRLNSSVAFNFVCTNKLQIMPASDHSRKLNIVSSTFQVKTTNRQDGSLSTSASPFLNRFVKEILGDLVADVVLPLYKEMTLRKQVLKYSQGYFTMESDFEMQVKRPGHKDEEWEAKHWLENWMKFPMTFHLKCLFAYVLNGIYWFIRTNSLLKFVEII